MLQPGVDVTAPPPPPPTTPADASTVQFPSNVFDSSGSTGGHGGGVSRVGDTEAFAIDEAEGEEPYFSASGAEEEGGRKEEVCGITAPTVEQEGELRDEPTSTWQSATQSFVEQEKDVGVEEGKGRGSMPETIKIEDFLAANDESEGDA